MHKNRIEATKSNHGDSNKSVPTRIAPFILGSVIAAVVFLSMLASDWLPVRVYLRYQCVMRRIDVSHTLCVTENQ